MKSRIVTAFLAFFFGFLGFHKFYLGRFFEGLLYIIFLWTMIPFFVSIIEGFAFLIMDDRVFDARYNYLVYDRGFNIPRDININVNGVKKDGNSFPDIGIFKKRDRKEDSSKVYCQNCGEGCKENFTFCPNCGEMINIY
ncbi:MAG: hypothetical protein CR982_04495 [Candidatus Cloacimonadota bacterium]|nr:MAG: hypothetical protein CR982_04495 [Candidatus Cloacimonadota bacterium]PIE80062.1 MAG: hypothetical protein CSA15_02255 [Candidatus Delongbacteria bacterium]